MQNSWNKLQRGVKENTLENSLEKFVAIPRTISGRIFAVFLPGNTRRHPEKRFLRRILVARWWNFRIVDEFSFAVRFQIGSRKFIMAFPYTYAVDNLRKKKQNSWFRLILHRQKQAGYSPNPSPSLLLLRLWYDLWDLWSCRN